MAMSLTHTIPNVFQRPVAEDIKPVVDSFPLSIVQAAFQRAGGLCECSRQSHGHISRCSIPLVYQFRGIELPGGWEAYHIDQDGPNNVDNCEIVCIPCHKTIHGK